MRNKIGIMIALVLLSLSIMLMLTGCGHEHEYGEWTVEKEPTCTETGNRIRVCECGEKETQAIEPLGHTDGEWVTDIDATCTEEGSKHQECSVCSESIKTEAIEAKGHTEVVDKAVASTCTKTGLTEGKHCSVCNAVTVAQTTVKAKGHTEVVDKAVAATCTTTGLTEGKHCSVCNAVTVAQTTVKAKGHTEVVDKAVAATCTKSGLTEGKHCSVCNTVTVAQKTVKAKGHNYTEATCISPKKCQLCGTLSGSPEPHSNNTFGVCKYCNKKMTASDYEWFAVGDYYKQIKSNYPSAKALGAYLILYTDKNGDLCLLCTTYYKIVGEYVHYRLYNISESTIITDPADHYHEMADRYYGSSAIRYIQLSTEVIEKQITSLEAIGSMLKTGKDSGEGAFIDPKSMNFLDEILDD